MRHASARDLALYVTNHWNDTRLSELSTVIDPGPGDSPPDQDTLDHLISCCYQASLMRAPLLQSRSRAHLEFVWSLGVLLDFSVCMPSENSIVGTLIFIDHRPNLPIINDRWSINFLERIFGRNELRTNVQPVCFGSIRDSGKGNGDAFRALEDVTGAELKWLDPH